MAEDKKTEQEKAPDKMMLFAAEYIIDWNGTRAYKKVYGLNDDNAAAACASRLLRNAKVVAEIDRLLKKSRSSREARKARVIDELEKIAYDDLQTDVYRDKKGEIIGVSRKDRVKALELLGKTEAMFTDKVERDDTVHIKHTFDPEGV